LKREWWRDVDDLEALTTSVAELQQRCATLCEDGNLLMVAGGRCASRKNTLPNNSKLSFSF